MTQRWLTTLVVLLSAAAFPAAALGDAVILREGGVRYGRIVSRDRESVRLEMDDDGLRATVVIPMERIMEIVEGAMPPASRGAAATGSTMPSAGKEPATAAAATQRGPKEARFFRELALTSAGHGKDSPVRLSPEQRQLWQNVLDAEASGKLDALLMAQKAMVEAMPGEGQRLNAIGLREKGKAFGQWMAETRWQLVSAKYRGGAFDLREVTEIERAELLAILRSQAEPAIGPLRVYFPPMPRPGERPVNVLVNPLLGINTTNALEVKDRALFAAAILAAQLKLDGGLSNVERAGLAAELMYVRRCIARASDFEPAARAALARQERERRMAEERARREAKLQNAGPRP